MGQNTPKSAPRRASKSTEDKNFCEYRKLAEKSDSDFNERNKRLINTR